jgi:hypothetical protein
MMEAIRSSETSVLGRATWRHSPEDDILHNQSRKNLKSYTTYRLPSLGTAYQMFAPSLVLSNQKHKAGRDGTGNNQDRKVQKEQDKIGWADRTASGYLHNTRHVVRKVAVRKHEPMSVNAAINSKILTETSSSIQ